MIFSSYYVVILGATLVSQEGGRVRQRPRLAELVDGGYAVDGGGDVFEAGFELEGKVSGVVAGFGEVAAVEPEVGLVGGLPHVAEFAFPGAGVVLGIGAEAPDFADAVGDFR